MPSNPKRHGARSGNGSTGSHEPSAPAATAAPETAPSPAAAPAQSAAPTAAPAAEGSKRLNITDLKDMSIQKLTQIAKDLNVGGATGMRKQELIFQILKAQTEMSGFIFSEGVLEVLPTGSDSCARPTTTTCRGPTTSTFRRRRSASSTCRPATPSRARSGRRKKASATSR